MQITLTNSTPVFSLKLTRYTFHLPRIDIDMSLTIEVRQEVSDSVGDDKASASSLTSWDWATDEDSKRSKFLKGKDHDDLMYALEMFVIKNIKNK